MAKIVQVGAVIGHFGDAARKPQVVKEEPDKILALAAHLRQGNMNEVAEHINSIMPKVEGGKPVRSLYAYADSAGCLTITDASGKIPLLSIQKGMEGQNLTVVTPIDKDGKLQLASASLGNSDGADQANSPLRKLIQGILALSESSKPTTAIMVVGVIERAGLSNLFQEAAPNGPALTEQMRITAHPAAQR